MDYNSRGKIEIDKGPVDKIVKDKKASSALKQRIFERTVEMSKQIESKTKSKAYTHTHNNT